MMVNQPPEMTVGSESSVVRTILALLLVLVLFVASFVSLYQNWITNATGFLNNLLEITGILLSLYLVVILINRH